MLRVAIIVGSTRPGRKGEAVARWVYEIAGSRGDAKFELVDIKDYDLPLLDESMSAISGKYSQAAAKGPTSCPERAVRIEGEIDRRFTAANSPPSWSV
jgi:NAD(P)H-dependent FMN reductase